MKLETKASPGSTPDTFRGEGIGVWNLDKVELENKRKSWTALRLIEPFAAQVVVVEDEILIKINDIFPLAGNQSEFFVKFG